METILYIAYFIVSMQYKKLIINNLMLFLKKRAHNQKSLMFCFF